MEFDIHTNRRDFIKKLAIGSAIIGAGFFILLFGNNLFLAIISMVIITLGEMLFMPVSQTLVYQSCLYVTGRTYYWLSSHR